MRRRIALIGALSLVPPSLLTACSISDPKNEKTTVMTSKPSTPEEALTAVGLPVPDAELTLSEGIVNTELLEWSLRVTFTGSAETVQTWMADAFGEGTNGLPVSEDGAPISPRIAPEEVHTGMRWESGSNPRDPNATYTVLISSDGTDVVVAAARTTR